MGNSNLFVFPRNSTLDHAALHFLNLYPVTKQRMHIAPLHHTHLLGRHLVLEWAEEAERDLEVLRKKAGVGFGGGKDMPGKKRKLDLLGGRC